MFIQVCLVPGSPQTIYTPCKCDLSAASQHSNKYLTGDLLHLRVGPEKSWKCWLERQVTSSSSAKIKNDCNYLHFVITELNSISFVVGSNEEGWDTDLFIIQLDIYLVL